MKLVSTKSLAETLDRVNEAFFTGQKLISEDKLEVARFIASRHGLYGSYANMFAPTQKDFDEGIKVFTGEKVRSDVATSHVLGEEASRILNILKVSDKGVQKALDEAVQGIQARFDEQTLRYGFYCCGFCTASQWRHAVVGTLKKGEILLERGVKTLKMLRLGDGKWRRFPFYYTLLALSEIELPNALGEIKYAAPVLERMLRRKASAEKYSIRRHMLAERVLAKI
jgi:hypothetical protein